MCLGTSDPRYAAWPGGGATPPRGMAWSVWAECSAAWAAGSVRPEAHTGMGWCARRNVPSCVLSTRCNGLGQPGNHTGVGEHFTSHKIFMHCFSRCSCVHGDKRPILVSSPCSAPLQWIAWDRRSQVVRCSIMARTRNCIRRFRLAYWPR